MADQLFPVCSPTLLDGSKPLRNPEDLANHTLLHTSGAQTTTGGFGSPPRGCRRIFQSSRD